MHRTGIIASAIRQILLGVCALALELVMHGQASSFHGAPASNHQLTYPSDMPRANTGREMYANRCASCHGIEGRGSGNVPPLTTSTVKAASPGDLFWFISEGSPNNGMPSSKQLPEVDRWQIVRYLKSAAAFTTPQQTTASAQTFTAVAPPPKPPFTDYRFENPGAVHKIRVRDLPAPFDTPSAGNGPTIVPRPEDAWPKVPAGFRVTLYASGLDNPRRIRRAPNGDLFVAEVSTGKVEVFRGLDTAGHPQAKSVFAGGLDRPFGIAFYPSGSDPKWVYIGTTNAILRLPYKSGALEAGGPPEHIMDLPKDGHFSRDILFDGKKLLIGVGSFSNADDGDLPLEKNRAAIYECNPDGSDMHIYASGIRNPSFLALDPKTKQLWATVNERDGLGDNLAPDYITHVQRGGFYGWPWWYMGGHQDPRHTGKHPELRDKVITPDVLVQPHNASVGMTFYDGRQFPSSYWGDIFATEHGSWNKSVFSGYEVIRVPLHQSGKATGEYEDFMTGFVIDDKRVWGRPSGIAVGSDGSLFVSDDASNSIWRVDHEQ